MFVVCRLRESLKTLIRKNIEELNQVKLTYSKEPFDLFMNCRESLDRTMKFQDVVYYSKNLINGKKTLKQMCHGLSVYVAHFAGRQNPNKNFDTLIRIPNTKKKQIKPSDRKYARTRIR